MITLLAGSFFAGLLTILAPCTLPIIPIVVGGSMAGARGAGWKRPLIIIASLGLSIFAFTLLLRASTALIGIPTAAWQGISGAILIGLGISFAFPTLWDSLSLKLNLSRRSNEQLAEAGRSGGTRGAVLTGLALGPVFASCSPTYLFIVASVLPRSFTEGVLALLAYVAGMMLLLFVVAYSGSRLVHKLGWALNPHGIFRRAVGVVFIFIGLGIMLGWDKNLQSWLLEQGVYDGTSGLEDLIR